MARARALGEFRFVPGPTYYKRLHGENLHLKRLNWSDDKRLVSWGALAAWMAEAIVPAGSNQAERRQLFDAVLDRFVVPHAPWKWVRAPARLLSSTTSPALYPLRALLERIKRSEQVVNAVTGRWMLYETSDQDQRAALLGIIFDRLRSEGRFDPQALLQSTWETLEDEARKRFNTAASA